MRGGQLTRDPTKSSVASRCSRRRLPAPDRGMVTAELAVVIPAVVLVLVVCVAGLMAALDQIRCVDAAALASRAAARGDSPLAVRMLAERAAPDGAIVALGQSGGQAHVSVRATTGGWGGIVPTWVVSASASTPVEAAVGWP